MILDLNSENFLATSYEINFEFDITGIHVLKVLFQQHLIWRPFKHDITGLYKSPTWRFYLRKPAQTHIFHYLNKALNVNHLAPHD